MARQRRCRNRRSEPATVYFRALRIECVDDHDPIDAVLPCCVNAGGAGLEAAPAVRRYHRNRAKLAVADRDTAPRQFYSAEPACERLGPRIEPLDRMTQEDREAGLVRQVRIAQREADAYPAPRCLAGADQRALIGTVGQHDCSPVSAPGHI